MRWVLGIQLKHAMTFHADYPKEYLLKVRSEILHPKQDDVLPLSFNNAVN